MIKTIKLQTTKLYNQVKTTRYEFTQEGLAIFITVKPRAQEMLFDLLTLTGNYSDVSSVIVNATYQDLGFKDQSNMNKYKNELVDKKLLFFSQGQYFINPVYINYYTRRQRDYFFKLFNLKKDIPVVMTNPIYLKKVQ